MKKIRIPKPTKKIRFDQLGREIRDKHSLGTKFYGLSMDNSGLDTYVDDDVNLSSTQIEQDVADHVPEEQQEYVEDALIRSYIDIPNPSIDEIREVLKIVVRRALITPEE